VDMQFFFFFLFIVGGIPIWDAHKGGFHVRCMGLGGLESQHPPRVGGRCLGQKVMA